jgi:hypothetical protein
MRHFFDAQVGRSSPSLANSLVEIAAIAAWTRGRNSSSSLALVEADCAFMLDYVADSPDELSKMMPLAVFQYFESSRDKILEGIL